MRFNELFLGGYLTRLQRDRRLQPDRARRWWVQLKNTETQSHYLAAVTLFIASGTH